MKNSHRFSLVNLSYLYLLFSVNLLLAQSPILTPPPSIGSSANKQNIPNLLTFQHNLVANEKEQTVIAPIEIVNETTWNGTRWSNGNPDAFTKAVFNANYVASDILDVYDINIKDGVKIILAEGALLKSKQFLSKKVKDKIIMQENSGTLCKLPNTTLSVFTRDNGIVNQYSSMFMSSPVTGQTIGDTFTDASGSPNVSHAYRQYNGAGFIPESFVMLPGNGYIETTNGNGMIDAAQRIDTYDHTYTGTENTTNYPISVINGYNLVGNPYASSLDSDSFLLDPSNTSASCIFLWTRNTLASSLVAGDDVYNFSTLDYAMYNVLGGINAGRDITLNSRTPIGSALVPFSDRKNYNIPDGKIHFGTSFYLRTSSAGTVTFKNTMTTSPTGQIFRHSASNRLTNTALITPPTRSRIWLTLSEGNSYSPTSGRYRQALIGYAVGATTGSTDRLFDAEPLNHFTYVPLIDIYSFAPSSTTKLAIQGRDNFQNTDSFQLGFKVVNVDWANSTQNFTFSASQDGMFNTKPYYIFDAADGQYHTLPYTFSTAAGTFDNRFKVVFENLVSFVSNPIVCGTTLPDIDYPAFAQNISGVTTYKYEVRYSNGNFFGEFNAPNPVFPYRFTLNLPGITYNTTYNLRVATYQINGVWQYGPTCTVTTPLNPPKSYLQAANCNSTITSYSTTIRCQIISALGIDATRYRFNVTDGLNTYSYTTPLAIPGGDQKNRCNLYNFSPMPLTPNTTYSFTVDALWDNNWQIGTQVCTVNTSNSPSPRSSESDLSIFEVSSYPNPFQNNFKLDINTSSEEKIEIKVYDMLGRQMESRLINISNLDTQEIGETYASGIYNVILKQGENIKTLRMVKR